MFYVLFFVFYEIHKLSYAFSTLQGVSSGSRKHMLCDLQHTVVEIHEHIDTHTHNLYNF